MSEPELSLLIVNYNTWRYCVDALRSFVRNAPTRADGTPMPWEAIVVDNRSPHADPGAEAELEALLAECGGRLIRNTSNAGYSQGMNLAFAHARGRWILVSNPDVLYLPNTVDPLLRAMERDASIGAAAPAGFWDPRKEGRLPPNILPTLRDLAGLTLAELSPRMARRYSRKRTRDAVRVWTATGDVELRMLSGCCFLMQRALIDRLGTLFDPRFPLYYEDTDLSVRIARAEKRIVQVGGAEVVHLFDRSGQSDPAEKMARYWKSRRLYYRKWYGRLGGWLYDLSRRVLRSKWAERRRAAVPHPVVHDLGEGHGKPVIRLERPLDRFLVEFALDPRFYLAGGILASGDSWAPNDVMFQSFGETVYWFRVVDLTRPGQRVVGIWKYQQRFPAVALESSPEADRIGRAVLVRLRGEPAPAFDLPVLSVVVLSWNTCELTLACLRALFAETPKHAREVIVVDNGSSDGSADAIAREHPEVRLLRNAENRGYSAGNNQGAALARGRFLCLLNSDTEVRPGALDRLVDFLESEPDYGMAAPRLVHPDGSVQRACMAFPGLLTAWCYDTVWGRFWPGRLVDDRYHMRAFDHVHSRDVDQPPGACCVLRTSEYRALGGLDEDLWLFFNDVDLCRRLRARGRRIRYLAEAEVMHHTGASTRGFEKFVVTWHRNRLAYYRKHYGRWVMPYMRLVVRMRAVEEWVRAGRRYREQGARRAARDYVRGAVREILAPMRSAT